MLVPDIARAAGEIARVLRPGGRVALAVWADPDDNDWMTAPGRSALELGLAERPDPEAPGPFRLSRDGLLGEVLTEAGLTVETVEDVAVTWRVAALSDWWARNADTSRALARSSSARQTRRRMPSEPAPNGASSATSSADGSLVVPGLARVALARRPT